MQALLDRRPQAQRYYSGAYSLYELLIYIPGQHQGLPNKSQACSVEGDNAEARHHLARLARSSRRFSRSVQALSNAFKLFVYAWNRRQTHRQRFPDYLAHVRDFVCT